jgi:hypothetical protein
MTTLSQYCSTLTHEDIVELKANKYRAMGPTQFDNLFRNAQKAELDGKDWKPETKEAIEIVGLESGLIEAVS